MQRFVTLLFCALVLSVGVSAFAASDAVIAEPEAVAPGQSVTLRWYFTGNKVVVSGGRFGKGQIVTGRTSLTDRPLKPTRYTFEVWFNGQAPSSTTGESEKRPLHATYTVEVGVGAVPPLTSYKSPHGWQVSYVSGWKHDHVDTPDEGKDGLVFFQKEDDSVERLAVAVLAVGEKNCSDVMQQVRADMPERYDNVQILKQMEITHKSVPAFWTVFTGRDRTHGGASTQSLVLVMVRDGRAYVVSARTSVANFKKHQALLESMVRSFTLVGPRKSARLDLASRS